MTELLRGVILDMDSIDPGSLDTSELQQSAAVDWQIYASTQAEQTAERIAKAHLVLTNKVALDAAAIAHATHLEYVGVMATGTNNVDHEACSKRGITVRNVADYGTASVAQHTLLLMLTLATSIGDYARAVKRGSWSKAEHFCLLDYPIVELCGKTLLIVGYGTLGKAVAKLAEAFGMQVVIARRPGVDAAEYAQPRVSLDEGLQAADFVSLHCALSAQTETLINAQRLNLMKPTAYLINTARGGLIDEAALLDALTSKQIAGAALDVLSTEPPPSTHCLLQKTPANLIITPHIAWAARESRQRLLDAVLQHVSDYIAGRNA